MQVTSPAAQEAVAHETLAEALAAFQMELPTVRKGNQATIPGKEGRSGYNYQYADLTDVSEVALPLLGKHGLAWHTGLDTVNGEIGITWRLMHGASGTELNGFLPVGRAGSDWRAMGSGITYARRYALTAATGVAPGGDDDDAAANVSAGSRQDQPAQRQERPQAPVQSAPREPLPEGLYDLSTVTSRTAAEAMYQAARKADHLTKVIGEEVDGQVVPIEFGQWLIKTGRALAEAEAAATAGEESQVDPADAAEAAEAAAVAAHEAAQAAAEQAPGDAQA